MSKLCQDEESTRKARNLISEMLDHTSISVALREGKRTMTKYDEKDEDKGEDSPMSCGA